MKRITAIIAAAALTLGSFGTADAKKVHTIGDSTMANYDEKSTVTRGWCQYLQQFMTGIDVNNRGKNGASSKSFYKEAAYWTSVKKQMKPGDYVLIQFSHNDEKTSGMDGDEVKAYYNSIGETAKANSTDYRGTCPNTTYKDYLRKYVNETREAGCTPILVAPVCRMYFSGNTIKRNGRHDLGDKFSVLTSSGIKENQKVAATDHSMDYPYQMKLVAEELNVPYVDMTTASADLYLSYGQADCMAIISDGDGSTHLSATGATLLARRFAQLCKEQGLLSEYINLKSDFSVSPESADLGKGYSGQSLNTELLVSGFDLTPASGNISVSTQGNVTVSTDKAAWQSTLSVPYSGGTIIQRVYAQMTITDNGKNEAKVIIKAGDKTKEVALTATGVDLAGGTEVDVYWRLESDESYTAQGPVTVIPESLHEMYVQKYSAPNASTVWPSSTGFTADRKTQRTLIEGDTWPAGEIDEVSTRYIEFGVTAMENTTLNIDEISYYVCGCGGNGMCLNVWYSTEDDFSNATLIMKESKMPANNMLDGKVQPIITVPGGKSLRLRFYPWYNGTATGKTLCLSDIRFHGFSTTGDSAIDETLINGSEVVSSTYYTIEGMAVEAPVKGNIYIVRDIYSDGRADSRKIRF